MVVASPDWKKCTCESIIPGRIHLPFASITFAPFGTGVDFEGPTAWIRSPEKMTVTSGSAGAPGLSGWISVPPTTAVILSAARAPLPVKAARAAIRRAVLRGKQVIGNLRRRTGL